MRKKYNVMPLQWILAGLFVMMSASVEALTEESLYQFKGRRDPFVSLASATSWEAVPATGLVGIENPNDIFVEGVMIDPGNKSMVIANGVLLAEGEESGKVKVVRVSQNGVVFSMNGMDVFRPVYQNESGSDGG